MLEKTEKTTTIIGTIISTILAIIAFFTDDKNKPDAVKATNTTPSGPTGLEINYTWILLAFSFIILIAIAVFLLIKYLTYQKKIKSSTISIGDRSLTSLNSANLKREEQNKAFKINSSKRTATIEGYNLEIEFESEGVRTSNSEEGYMYNVDSDNFIPFNKLKIYGYDLRTDPNRQNPVTVKLIATDDNCKRILVPFLKPVPIGAPFHIYMYCQIPNSIVEGEDYYSSTLSCNKGRTLLEQKVTLVFKKHLPDWVRVYEVVDGVPTLKHELSPQEKGVDFAIYKNEHMNIKDNKIIIYSFKRNF